jgi:glycosyltransferase involved in cell wall biosynthesis
MSLRIALTHVYCWPEVRGGGERYLHELAAALQLAGHRVSVLSTAPKPSRDDVLGVPVRRFRRRRLRPERFRDLSDEVAFGGQALAHLAPRPLDVWHAFGTADAAAAASLGRVRGVRSVYTDLGIPGGASRRRRPDRRLHQLVVDHVDQYLCLSEAAAAPLRTDFGRDPGIVGGGVDLARFEPAPAREPTPTLLFSGRLTEPRKNLALLLEALAVLRRRRPEVRLWLSGSGDPSATLAAAPPEAREATDVLGVGVPEDLVGLYGRAWATVLPSVHEAFGLVLVESLACGTPVVALDQGGPGEIVRPGVGATAEPTAASLADACEQVLDLAAAPGTTADCRAEAERYDWRTGVVPRLEALYG